MKLRKFRSLILTLLTEAAAFNDPALMAVVKGMFKNNLRTIVKDDLTLTFGEVMTMKSPNGGKMVRPGVLKKFGRLSQGIRAKFANIRAARQAEQTPAAMNEAATTEPEMLGPVAQSQFQTQEQRPEPV